MTSWSFLLLPLLILQTDGLQTDSDPLADYRSAAIERWEEEIQKLEELDQQESNPENAILFIGSSSIRRWESMHEDMHPWPTIRRGYGGARFSDLAVFIDRLVNPHQFAALVIFVGNDITGSSQDKSPEEVLRLYRYVVQRVRLQHAEQPIFLIGVTPTSSRFDVWPQVKQMHELAKQYSDQDDSLHFIDTAAAFLNEDHQPRDELFVDDKLHLNPDGYQLWASIIKRHLEQVLESPGKL